MSRFVRHLIIWVVAMLLPLQGYAAAAMISCGPMHAQAAKSQNLEGHEGKHGAQPCHEDNAAGKSSGSDSTPEFPDMFEFKCSACAACSTGTLGPVYIVPSTGSMPAEKSAIPFRASVHDGIVLDALERPPRTSLA